MINSLNKGFVTYIIVVKVAVIGCSISLLVNVFVEAHLLLELINALVPHFSLVCWLDLVIGQLGGRVIFLFLL